MTDLTVFAFDSHAVRVIERDGEPWFVAADICAALGLPNTTRALERLDEDEQTLISIQGMQTGPGNPTVNVINESGMYALILGSRKAEAKRFRKWVTSEVLPAIRKTGAYVDPGRVGMADRQPAIPAHAADRLVAASRTFNALLRAGRGARVPLPAAIRRAAEVAERETGVDLLAELRIDPDAMQSADADGPPASAAARAAVLDFWRALESGAIPGIGAGLPMLSVQLYTLYQHWARRAGIEPLHLPAVIHLLARQGHIVQRKKRHTRADGTLVWPKAFAWPAGLRASPYASGEPHWLGRCVAQAQAAIDDYAAAHAA